MIATITGTAGITRKKDRRQKLKLWYPSSFNKKEQLYIEIRDFLSFYTHAGGIMEKSGTRETNFVYRNVINFAKASKIIHDFLSVS